MWVRARRMRRNASPSFWFSSSSSSTSSLTLTSRLFLLALGILYTTTTTTFYVSAQNSSNYPTTQPYFTWGWRDQQTNDLAQCENLAVIVPSDSAAPTYPLWFFSYGGQHVPYVQGPITSATWNTTIAFPSGYNALFAAVDSAGHSGGVVPTAALLANSTNSACLAASSAAASTNNVQFSVNQTSSNVPVCSMLQMSISGGVSPYTVGIVVPGASTVHNITLDSGQSVFQWFNDVPANRNFMVVLSDSIGEYGHSTALWTSTVSNMTGCSNDPFTWPKSSHSSSSSSPSSSASSGASSGDDSKHNSSSHVGVGAIVGIVIAVVIVACAAVAGALFWRRRKNKQNEMRLFERQSLDGGGPGDEEYKDISTAGNGNNNISSHDFSSTDITAAHVEPFSLPEMTGGGIAGAGAANSRPFSSYESSPWATNNFSTTSSSSSSNLQNYNHYSPLINPQANNNHNVLTTTAASSPASISPPSLPPSASASPTPFLPTSTNAASSHHTVSYYSSPTSLPAQDEVLGLSVVNPDVQHQQSSSPSLSRNTSKRVPPHEQPQHQQEMMFRQHEDAGPFDAQALDDVPPSYSDRRT